MLLARLNKLVVLSFLMIIVYISKPDRGGFGRCQKIFGLDLLEQRGLSFRPFLIWKPFESAKFRMELEPNKGVLVKEYLVKSGFTHWIKGGVHFGSLNIGWDKSDLIYYSKKRVGKYVHIMAYDEVNGLLYAIEM